MSAPRIWLCNGCGATGPWSEAWSWYGSLKDLDDGEPIPTFCSDACRPNAAGLSKLRKTLRSDPHFVIAQKA
jgi:hypothetical protein